MTSDVLSSKKGALGLLILNRPQALNALTLDMVSEMSRALAAFEADAEVKTIAIASQSDKAFCAGGDVRALTTLAKTDPAAASAFFRTEYRLNAQIAACSKPLVALVDGLCFGGGMGLAANARWCLMSRKGQMAMPEMTIGLFPDVGAAHFLAKAPGEIGVWMALTGARLGADDAIWAKLASTLMEEGDQSRILTELARGAAVDDHLLPYAPSRIMPGLHKLRERIDTLFAGNSIEAIIARLEAETDDWAKAQLLALRRSSPTSLALALSHMRACRGLSLNAILERDFRIACACLRGQDFIEGVRAQLIDKDRNPRWQAAPLSLLEFEEPPFGVELFDS